MKYEAPELRASATAISAIQSGSGTTKTIHELVDSPEDRELVSAAYADWE